MPEPAATRRARPSGPAGAFDAWEIRWFASIDSTNRSLLDAARAGAPDGLVVVADHQTAGRGRLGRTWTAAPGSSLLVSVLLRPSLPAARLGLLTTAAGLALRDAVRAVAGVESRLKWPNDLVVGDRKLAGILAETEVSPGSDASAAVVVGAGCNVTAAAVAPELVGVATSCEAEATADVARPVDRSALLDAYLDALAARLADLDDVPRAARDASATLGRQVLVDLGARELRGEAIDITEQGALVVRDAAGGVHTVAAGDVVHLRAHAGDA